MGLKTYLYIGGAVIAALLVLAVKLHFAKDDRIEAERDSLFKWRSEAVEAVAEASDNRDTTNETAIGQIRAIGDSNRSLRAELDNQSQAIDDMAREAVRLRKKADEMKVIAAKAQAQRQAALRQLSDMSITPGTRDDCLALLKEANEALDIAREAGL